MPINDISILGTNGNGLFGTGTSKTWAQMRALTSGKTSIVDGSSFRTQSTSLAALGGVYEYFHTLFQFDTSNISNATAAEFRINCTSVSSAPLQPKVLLVKGDCTPPFSASNGLNRMLNWPSSPTAYSSTTPSLSTGMVSITLNATGISDINSGNTFQVYLIDSHQASDATAPTGTDDYKAIFDDTNLALRVTTPDLGGFINLSSGKIEILNGKISL